MISRQAIQFIPDQLRATLDKARAEYGAEVKKIHWGDGPVYVCGQGECARLAAASRYAFATFAGWPVVEHSAEDFETYSLALLRPRAVLLMISAQNEWPEGEALVRTALGRGAKVLALTNAPESALAKGASHVFVCPQTAEGGQPAATVCMHAAMNLLAFDAARQLKRPEPQWEAIQRDFDDLPGKLEWVFTQFQGVARSFALALCRCRALNVIGGGFYRYAAWLAAHRLQELADQRTTAWEASEFVSAPAALLHGDDGVLFISSSHSKVKKLIHRAATQVRQGGAKVYSLTDANDRDLAEGSDVGLLLPGLAEAPGATLMLFLAEWLAVEALRAQGAA